MTIIHGILFSPAAVANITETAADVATDLAALRSGEHSPESLLEFCLNGAEPDRVAGWREYVESIEAAAECADVVAAHESETQ